MWSPDGRTILINTGRLEQVRLDGSGPHAVPNTTDAAYGGNPTAQARWSPNGKRIFYIGNVGTCGGGTCEGSALFVVNADGSGKRNLTPTLKRVSSFAVSPGERRIVVAGGDGNVRDLFLLDANGGGIEKLGNPHRNESDDPEWSPGGAVLAFTRYSGATDKSLLYLVNADGSALTSVSPSGADTYLLGWRP